MFHKMIEKAVHKSQHCQRNWDLTKEVPERDLRVMETAVTQCPSKQNYAYYKPYLITNREIIQSIYKHICDCFSKTIFNCIIISSTSNR